MEFELLKTAAVKFDIDFNALLNIICDEENIKEEDVKDNISFIFNTFGDNTSYYLAKLLNIHFDSYDNTNLDITEFFDIDNNEGVLDHIHSEFTFWLFNKYNNY